MLAIVVEPIRRLRLRGSTHNNIAAAQTKDVLRNDNDAKSH